MFRKCHIIIKSECFQFVFILREFLRNSFGHLIGILLCIFLILVKRLARSVITNKEPLWFLPIIKSTSISPNRSLLLMIWGRCSIDTLFGIIPLRSFLFPRLRLRLPCFRYVYSCLYSWFSWRLCAYIPISIGKSIHG